MLAITTIRGYHRTMSPNAFRLAIVVIVIAVVAISLLGVMAFTSVVQAELTDRSVLVLGMILGFLGPTVLALLNLLKTDRVQQKTEDVHHDLLNGGLRENVKRAISEAEADPAIREQRIENVAKGVSRDRHAKANRQTIERNAPLIEQLRRRKAQQDDEA